MLSALFTRLKVVFQTAGLVLVLSKKLRFLLLHSFRYDTYYLYKHTMMKRNEADFMPKIQDFTLNIVFTNQQADELAVAMGVDFRSYINNARRMLDKGAIAFCIFVKSELANIGWVAMTQEAKNIIDPTPYRVIFSDKEACTGSTRTIPKYRGKGLMTYSFFRRYEFLREQIIAKIYRLRILKLVFYKEISLTEINYHD